MPHHYIFDVDYTLYPLGHPFGKDVFTLINTYIGELIGKTGTEVQTEFTEIRKAQERPLQYFSKTYNVPLEKICQYPTMYDYKKLMPCKRTQTLLKNLTGHKHTYTDGVKIHAEKTLAALKIEDTFTHLFGIEAGGHLFKKAHQNFAHILQKLETQGHACTFIEDNVANLKPAKASGMRTILLTHSDQDVPDWVDETAPNLPTWLQTELTRV